MKKWCYVDLGPHIELDARYVIDDKGNVYTNRIRKNKEIYLFGCREYNKLGEHPDKKGYLKVKLYDKHGVSHTRRVHKVLIESYTRDRCSHLFKDIKIIGYHVDHIDGNVQNNSIYNLRWITNDDNIMKKLSVTHNWTKELKDTICELYFIQKLSFEKIQACVRKGKEAVSNFLHGVRDTGYVEKWCEERNIPYLLFEKSNSPMKKQNVTPISILIRERKLSPETA